MFRQFKQTDTPDQSTQIPHFFSIPFQPAISFSNLLEKLTTFLLPHRIHPSECDIFEETLLLAAGVKTHPTKCQFLPCKSAINAINDDRITFRIAGITFEDMQKFAHYCVTQSEENRHVTATFDTATMTADIEVDLDVAYHKLLPAFQATFNHLYVLQLDHYSALSANNNDVKDYSKLQDILILLEIAILVTDKPVKIGMLTILHSQLSTAIAAHRQHQLHNCMDKTAADMMLLEEIVNFKIQTSKFQQVLEDDGNIKEIDRLMLDYFNFYNTATNHTTASPVPTTPRSDSPINSIARLFSSPPRTPSVSRTSSTESLYSGPDFESISLGDEPNPEPSTMRM